MGFVVLCCVVWFFFFFLPFSSLLLQCLNKKLQGSSVGIPRLEAVIIVLEGKLSHQKTELMKAATRKYFLSRKITFSRWGVD